MVILYLQRPRAPDRVLLWQDNRRQIDMSIYDEHLHGLPSCGRGCVKSGISRR